MLRRLNTLLEKLVAGLAVALLALVFAVVLAQVFFRYFLNAPLIWSEELAQYAFIWISFLGWMLASRRGAHIAVNAVRGRLPPRARDALDLVFAAAAVGFALYLGWQGLLIGQRNLAIRALTFPMSFAVVYAIVPISAALLVLMSLEQAAASAKRLVGRDRSS